ncbi:MAG: tetratricopeptide repeat protein [Gammaproteobacteria bacterium]|nr:tetratricopeptide repeat protein [Gammaproteobacteria bacterium]
MSHYETEQEQLEKVKRWWADNGTALMLGLALGLGGLSGWRYYEARKVAAAEQAGLSFDLLNQALQQDKIDEAKQIGEQILANHGESSYATLAALLLAKAAVLQKNHDEARQRLHWVAAHANATELKQIAVARIAETLLAEGRAEEAWAELERGGLTIVDAFLEIRGDVLAAQGKVDEARLAYLGALAKGAADGGNQNVLQLKLDSLPAPLAATATTP